MGRGEYDAHLGLMRGASRPARPRPAPKRRPSLLRALVIAAWLLGAVVVVGGLYATSECQPGVRCAD